MKPLVRSELPYRKGVGAILFDRRGRVFVGKRVDCRDGSDQGWQCPQGGIDAGETPRQSLSRELAEEIGTDRAEVITETAEWLTYDLPDDLVGRRWGGRYRGQALKWFALRFSGGDDEINLEASGKAEFCAWKWVEFDQLTGLIVPFKRALYEQVVAEFRHVAVSSS